MIINLIFLAYLSHAVNYEHHEPPNTRPRCNHGLVASCIAEHTAARAAQLELAASAGARVAILRADRDRLVESDRALAEKIRAKEVTISMIEREQKENSRAAKPILPGGPSPEEFFFRDPYENTWQELHAAERRARLNTLLESSTDLAAKMRDMQRRLATEISGLDQEIVPHDQALRLHAGNAEAHFSMCSRGCKEQFCSTD
jgi:hypothetical protein